MVRTRKAAEIEVLYEEVDHDYEERLLMQELFSNDYTVDEMFDILDDGEATINEILVDLGY